MARVGYCKHGTYTGHGENFRPCWQCETEEKTRLDNEEYSRRKQKAIITEVVLEILAEKGLIEK